MIGLSAGAAQLTQAICALAATVVTLGYWWQHTHPRHRRRR